MKKRTLIGTSKNEIARRSRRYKIIARVLKKLFPHAKIALNFSNNWELLVAVQLSAQCTDRMVNEITPALFRKYKKMSDYAGADILEFGRDIYKAGFYHNKARNIIAAAKYVMENYKGKLPKTMQEMIKIPGIGRKSANVILGNAYGVVDGIAVDTHVIRLSRLLGLTKEKNPEKIERVLMQIVPRKDWFALTYRLIEYGRKYCTARKHKHELCPLTRELASAKV